MFQLAVLMGDMIRRGIFGIALVLIISGCSSVTGFAQSFSAPCEQAYYPGNLPWSPDGKQIAFTAVYPPRPLTLYIMNADGTGLRPLAQLPEDYIALEWRPDGKALAFSDQHDIYTVGLDGTITRTDLPTELNGTFRYSPDSTTIAYNSYSTEDVAVTLNVIHQDGSGSRQLTTGQMDYLMEWSPDGTQIAYLHYSLGDRTMRVSIVRADGSQDRHLAAGDGPVNWSPDSQWLAYYSPNDEGVRVIKADGSGDKLIAKSESGPYGWLPNSQYVVLVTLNDELNAYDIDTLAVKKLGVKNTTAVYSPWYSEDFTQEAYLLNDDATASIGIMQEIHIGNPDGTGQTRITDNPGKYQCFRWPF